MFTTTIRRNGFCSRYSGTYRFGARMYKNNNGEWVVDCGYGYKNWATQHKEKNDSILSGQDYRMVHQILPRSGDEIRHEESGRVFIVGKAEKDFLVYEFPLLENGERVAILRAEEYYKD